MVSTPDSESGDPSSSLGGTFEIRLDDREGYQVLAIKTE